MIFLGAGASAPFGPKLYSCITKEVWNVLRKYNVEEICTTAQTKLMFDKVVFDFEAILTIFEFLKYPSKGIAEVGPLLSWLRRNKLVDELKCTPDKAEEVVKELKEVLYRNCSNIDMAEVNRVHDKFFGVLKRSEGGELGVDHDIFTTNYDMIIEEYHWDRTKQVKPPRLKTGFEPNRDPRLLEFQPDKSYGGLDPYLEKKNVRRLFKLHGSIDQKIENYIAYKYPQGFEHDMKSAKDMMVFPIAEKYITQYPYFDLYYYLRGVPWTVGSQKETCIAIGFSFRDIPIINAFVSHIIENERKKMKSRIILVDKDTTSVIENLETLLSKEDFERICKTIEPVQGEFGSNVVFKKLEERLGPTDRNSVAID